MNVERREVLKGVALLAVTEKLTDGGFAAVSLPGEPAERVPKPLPPGARDARSFADLCVGCGLCVSRCAGACLVPSASLFKLGRPEMDFRHGYCAIGCTACGDVCPTGAIFKLQVERRPHVHIGEAVFDDTRCLRLTEGENCSACVRKCPVRAIHLANGKVPHVDASVCIGCGACQHVCPARPHPAIYVKGYAKPRVVVPLDASDLIAEMRARIAAGQSVVVAKEGVIRQEAAGRGLAPLVAISKRDADAFAGALVYDKVVGRAAAAFYVVGKARRVCADVMSDTAAKMLRDAGVQAEARQFVPEIANRDRSGLCPMEQAVMDLNDPRKMIEELVKRMEKK